MDKTLNIYEDTLHSKIIIVPYIVSSQGNGIATKDVVYLSFPASLEQLAASIEEGLNRCKIANEFSVDEKNDQELRLALGGNTWAKAIKGKKLVNLFVKETSIEIIGTTPNRGGYVWFRGDSVYLDKKASMLSIAEIVHEKLAKAPIHK